MRVQTSLLIFKRLPFILAAARFSDTAQTWKYQEGKAVGGRCHLFRHMFVLVLKGSLILETIQKYRGKKKARTSLTDRLGRHALLHFIVLYLFVKKLFRNFDVKFISYLPMQLKM